MLHFFQQRLKSFLPAIQGLKYLIKGEPNATVHLIATIVVLILGFVMHLAMLEWVAIIFCITSVIGAEALNSGIEKTVDLVTAEQHPLAGKAKDLAAAGVLVVSIGAFLVGVLIFGSHILEMFH